MDATFPFAQCSNHTGLHSDPLNVPQLLLPEVPTSHNYLERHFLRGRLHHTREDPALECYSTLSRPPYLSQSILFIYLSLPALLRAAPDCLDQFLAHRRHSETR